MSRADSMIKAGYSGNLPRVILAAGLTAVLHSRGTLSIGQLSNYWSFFVHVKADKCKYIVDLSKFLVEFLSKSNFYFTITVAAKFFRLQIRRLL